MVEMTDWVPRLHPDTGISRVGGRLLAAGSDDYLHVFEEASGQSSEVAERIVELADGQRNVRQIVDALCTEFEVDRSVCEKDTVTFVQRLVQLNVLVLLDPSPPSN